MKVLIKRTCAAQGQHLEEGTSYELDTSVANDLIRMGRAVVAPAEVKAPPRKVKANAAD